MAETAVWVPYESPAHVRATASSTVDVDLMVSVDGTGFASANLQDHASCSVDPSLDRHRSDACSRHSVGGAECRECAGDSEESDAESNAGPQSIVQLASCTPSVTPAACAVVAEPWELATARALHGRGLDHRV